MAALFVATALMFAVHSSLWLALALLLVTALAAAPFAARRTGGISFWSGRACSRSGSWPGSRSGGSRATTATRSSTSRRVQKLLALHDLSLRSVDEFRDGGLHPGYAFPLWHVAVAVIAKLAGVGAPAVFLHAADGAAAALVRARLRGRDDALRLALGRCRDGAGAVRAARARARHGRRVHLAGAAGDGLADAAAAGAARARLRLRPRAVWRRRSPSVAAASTRDDARPPELLGARRGRARRLPASCARCSTGGTTSGTSAPRWPRSSSRPAWSSLWLLPIVRETASHNPSRRRAEPRLRRTTATSSTSSAGTATGSRRSSSAARARSRSPRSLLLPLAVFAHRRLWAAFVLGAMLATFAVTLLPFVFPHFADAVSISQARRIIGFSPRPFVLVGGALVLARLPALCAAAGRARGGDRAPAGLSRATSACPTASLHGAAGLADLGRASARRGRRAARRRALRPPDPAGRRARRSWPRRAVGALPAAGGGARLLALDAAAERAARRCRRRSSRPSAREVPRRRRRLLRPADRLRARGLRAGLRQRRADDARRRHARRTGRRRAQATRCASSATAGRSRSPRRYGAHWLLVDRARVGTRLVPPAACVLGVAVRSLPDPVKVLLVTMYFPPAGGGGVQRPLKFATHLPALGIETHVLAPDDPKWIHRDDELRPPTQAWVHRARYLGPEGAAARRGAARHAGARALALARRGCSAAGCSSRTRTSPGTLTAIPAAIRIVKREGIDVVITTSPPLSVHLVGAAVKRRPACRGSPTCATRSSRNPHRALERKLRAREGEGVEHVVAQLVARTADAIVAVSEAIADEMRALEPGRPGRDDRERLRLRRLRRARVPRRATASGSRTPAASSASATRGRS